ncbi:MAG: LysE family translocator [Anaerolinea sp.]|nr:LysE family translocator [Anaerolinea sp.]
MESLLPLSSLSLFFAGTLILLITPGPAVLYIVARSVDQGRRAGVVSVLGIQTGTLVHVIAAALGLSALLFASAELFTLVKYLGAAYLIYLGIKTLMERKTVDASKPVERRSLGAIYRQGVIVAILNPKTALFFLAFLPQFVDPSRGSVGVQFLLLGIMFTALAACTDGTWAILSGTAGNWLKRSPHFLRAQKTISGTVYIGLGLVTAFSGGDHQT